MAKAPILCVLLGVAILGIGAEGGSLAGRREISQEMLPLSSSVYEEMDILYLASGLGTPSDSRPWTKTEAAQILGRIDRAGLDGALAVLWDRTAEQIRPGMKFSFGDGFGFGAGLDLFFEAYAHTNQGFDLESDWIRGFESRKPLARVSLDFSLKDFLYMYCDMQYGRNRFNTYDDLYYALSRYPGGLGAIIGPGDVTAVLAGHSAIYSAAFLSNVLLEPRDFDYQWPKRALASIGGSNWNLVFARDRLRWGNGHSGSFVVDDHSDYQDFARLSAFSEHFKYEWLFVFLESSPAQGEVVEERFRTLLAHRLEFRILKRVSFAISENVLYQNDVFDLKYLNPAFIYHNLNKRNMFNAIAHAELDWNFARGWKLYGQGVLDQGRAPTESSIQADATGWLAGLEYAGPAGSGLVTSSLEFTYTSPLLYRRDGLDFIAYRKYYTNGDPSGPNMAYTGFIVNLDYLGYQYGGDSLVLQWDGAYRIPGLGKAALRLFGMRHGEMDFYLSHNKDGVNAGFADYPGTTPSGENIDEVLAASLLVESEGSRLRPWLEARFWLELDWVGRTTYRVPTKARDPWEFDVQATAGFSLSI